MEAISIKLPEDIIGTIKEIEETEQIDKATAVKKTFGESNREMEGGESYPVVS